MPYQTNVPKPANQGGHAAANVQGTKIQKKQPSTMPAKDGILYTSQPSGFGGSKKTY